MLYARVGQGHCPKCSRPITAQTPRADHRPDRARLPTGTRFVVLAPLIRGQKGEYRDLFEDLLKQGFARARVDGRDRAAHRRSAARSADAAQHRSGHRSADGRPDDPRRGWPRRSSWRCGWGRASLIVADGRGSADAAESSPKAVEARSAHARRRREPRRSRIQPFDHSDGDLALSAHYACTHCGLSFEPPSPQLFSFNSPQGMCPTCDGLGEFYSFDPERLVPDRRAVVQAGLRRADRAVARHGPLAAAHLSRRGRHARAQARPAEGHDAGNALGRARSRACKRSGCGAPATSTSRSPGAAARRATNTAAGSRASSPSCSTQYRTTQEPHAAPAARKVHERHRCAACDGAAAEPAGPRGHAHHAAPANSPIGRAARCPRSARWPCRDAAEFFSELELDATRPDDRRRSAQGNSRPARLS